MNKVIESLKENPLFLKYRTFLVPIISFLVCIILILFIIIPQIQDYLRSQSEEESLNGRIFQLTQKREVLESIDTDLYKSNLEMAMRVLPSDQDIPGAVGDLLVLLSSNRLRLVGISFSGGDFSLYGSKALVIKIDTEGDADSMKSFLSNMGDSIRIMRVGRIETSGDSTGGIIVSFDVAAFYDPIPVVSNSLDAPVALPTKEDLEFIKRIETAQDLGPDDLGSTTPLGKDNLFE